MDCLQRLGSNEAQLARRFADSDARFSEQRSTAFPRPRHPARAAEKSESANLRAGWEAKRMARFRMQPGARMGTGSVSLRNAANYSASMRASSISMTGISSRIG